MLRLANFTLYLSFVSLIYSADNNQVVTEPYKPSRLTYMTMRYPTASRIIKAFCVGGGVKVIADKLSKSDSLGTTLGAAAFVGTYLYLRSKSPELLDALLINPAVVSDYNERIGNSFNKELRNNNVENLEKEDSKKALELYKQILPKYEKFNPLFLLGECVKEDWSYCVLARNYKPQYREQYESVIAAELNNKLKVSQNLVHYISFGSGGLLQDLVVLTKVLAQNPSAAIDIHVIDVNYSPVVAYLDLKNNGKDRDMNKSFADSEDIMARFVAYAKQHFGGQRFEDDVIENELRVTCETKCAKNRQFTNFLSKTFPKARLAFHIHESTDGYLKYIGSNGMSYPDVVTAVDIQDEMSLFKRSTYNYAKLCVVARQKKPDSVNIGLFKGYQNQKKPAGLWKLSLEVDGKPQTEIEELELDPNNKVMVHIGVTDLD